MTTKFDSPEEAKAYIAACCGTELSEMTFTPIDGVRVQHFGEDLLLDDPDTPSDLKKAIRQRSERQQAFRFNTPDGQEARIVIGPFRDGFDCWLVAMNGMAHRL